MVIPSTFDLMVQTSTKLVLVMPPVKFTVLFPLQVLFDLMMLMPVFLNPRNRPNLLTPTVLLGRRLMVMFRRGQPPTPSVRILDRLKVLSRSYQESFVHDAAIIVSSPKLSTVGFTPTLTSMPLAPSVGRAPRHSRHGQPLWTRQANRTDLYSEDILPFRFMV
jgi:hypothetical protein